MQMNESIENYLERILMLQQRTGAARSIDIARELGVTKASVSHAMKLLRENGYILMDSANLITLTPAGQAVAERMYKRHVALTELLMRLGVSKQTAETDACKIEHDISSETYHAICDYAERFML